MKQHLRYKSFIGNAVIIAPKRLIVYFLFFALSILIQNISVVYFNYSSLKLHTVYSLNLIIFVYLLPKFYLKDRYDFNIEREVKYFIIILLYFFIAILTDSFIYKLSIVEILLYGKISSELSTEFQTLLFIGFVEEYIFRQILLKQLVLQTHKARFSIFACSAIFTFMHLPRYIYTSHGVTDLVFNLIFAFLISALFGDIYFLSNSIIFVALIHSFLDFKIILLMGEDNMTLVYFGLFLIFTLPIVFRQLQRWRIIPYKY